MSLLSLILLIILLFMLVGTLPRWPYSSQWGYAPGGIVVVLLVVVLLLALFGHL